MPSKAELKHIEKAHSDFMERKNARYKAKMRKIRLSSIVDIAEQMGIDGVAFDIIEICKKELGAG